ncbi:MAG: bifunctional riboflavin kinase/FAD synthetase [Hyphomicrobiales bacterium]|nr:bifunctional riboflavin kinase/FAD synthetase [Hyphomicrobiales bacterium]
MPEHPTLTRPFTVTREAVSAGHPLHRAVIAIGNFDGVHRGHRAVIDTACRRAAALGRPAAALTFEPHPRSFFRPQEPLFRLTDERNKLRLLSLTGLDGAIVLPFDAALAALSADAFVEEVLIGRFAVAGVTIGFDFHFGAGRGGSPGFLADAGRRHGFAVDIVPRFEEHGRRISSEPIRAALIGGHVADAAAMLGFPWFVSGEVVHGDKRGRELGYPTANLRLDPGCGLRHGVYAVRAMIDGRQHDGVANFGRRPMFDVGTVLLEIFLFDFSRDIYGETIDVAFVEWIRPEMTFDTLEDLVRRMDDDSRIARMALGKAPHAVLPPLPRAT